MRRFSRYLILLVAALAVISFLFSRGRKQAMPEQSGNAGKAHPTGTESKTTTLSQNIPPPPSPMERLEAVLTQLATAKDGNTNRKLLAELRQFLDALPAEIASREVQSFLAGRKDAATGLDVTVTKEGRLGDASSLRVFLLDYLGQIDRPAAGVLAVQILSRYTTPDEWAVSLRNYAWANPGPASDGYLQGKSRELLSNPEWVKDPSAGFLEAFDTIVYAHGTVLAPALAELVRDKDTRATAHAAYLTLDRLTLAEPTAIFKQLVEQPDLMQGREQTRANFLARADVREAEQRAVLEQYLLDPARTGQELTTFAGLYPNANFMISNNLLTPTVTPKREELIAHDRAALETIREWQNDARFRDLKPHLETMRARLETFVQQAAANP